MAVTRTSKSIVMTAAADAVTGRLFLQSLQFQGTGLTAGQQWVISDGLGTVLGQGYVELTHENQEVLVAPIWVDGLVWTTKPAAGTAVVFARLA